MATDTLNGLNIVFPIYNEDGTPFHNLVLRKSVVDSIVMSLGDKITGDVFYKNNTLQVTMKEYVEYNGVHFSLVNPPTIVREGMVADNGELKGMTKYSFEFYHPMYQLSNFPFTDVATKTGEEKYLSQNKIFSWIGKPQDYIDKLNKNLQGTVWYVRKSDRFPVEKDDELSDVQQFDNISVAEAIKRGYEIWGTPYIVSQLTSNDPLYAQGKRFVVEYGLPSNEIYESESARQLDTPYVFQMGQGVGLKNNSRTPRNNKIVTRIAGYGSEDNVPYGYPQIVWTGNQDWDYTINNDPNNPLSYPIYKGIVGGQYVKLIKHPFTRTHLMPSIFTETVNKKVNPNADGYDPTIEIKDYYDAVATQEYPYVNEINLQAPSYESHEFADIKPELDADRDIGIVSAVPLNADLTPADHWDDSMDDDGNYLQSYFQITLPQLSFDLYACAAITQEMQINMRSGACIGCTFPVQVDWDDYKKNFYDKDGNFVPDGEQRDLTKYPKSNLGQINIIVQKDNSTFGTLMPNIYQQPKADDLFVFIGISLPLSYITNAEEKLDDAMKTYMLENNVYYFDYPLKFDEHFLATHTYILEQIRPNSIIHFDYGGVEQQLFVKQLTVKYGNAPLPQYDITLTDNVEVVLNQIGQVADDVEKLSFLIAILRQSYNRNVWIELAKKLSKVNDDTAQGFIRFVKGLQVGNMFTSGILGEGGVFRKDADGKTYIEADKMYIRMKAYFDSVEIREYQHTSGNRIASQAKGFTASRVEWLDADGKVLEQKSENLPSVVKFRCYWRAKDDEHEAENQFVVGDQAFMEYSDIVDGNFIQKRFWRVVTGRNVSLTEDGEAWIDLSNKATDTITYIDHQGTSKTQGVTGCEAVATSEENFSSIPQAEDDICQLGNVWDTERQGAIIEYVSGGDAPSYQIFQGINSFSLDGRNYIGLGYSSLKGRAYINVYGDAYIGDKPDAQGNAASYIRYNSTNKKLTIKADVDIQSTFGGKTFNEAIGGTTVIKDLQNQIDGAIESWFLNGAPVDEDGALLPSHEPYATWLAKDTKTDEETGETIIVNTERLKHLGDLYYDNETGYAYRFANTGTEANPVFAWQRISDTDIVKALEAAQKAQTTAEGKRTVYSVWGAWVKNGVNTLEVGDLFIPVSDTTQGGVVYKANKVYKCTAKGANTFTEINYTDDSKFDGYISQILNGTTETSDSAVVAQALHAIKGALEEDTRIDGGLIMTSLISLRSNAQVWSGINGVYNSTAKGGGIAAWYGGGMKDFETYGNYDTMSTDAKNTLWNTDRFARSLQRFDGSGYLASGNISWTSEGQVTIRDLYTMISGEDSFQTNILNKATLFANLFHTSTQGTTVGTDTLIYPQAAFQYIDIKHPSGYTLTDYSVLNYGEMKSRFLTKEFFDAIFELYNDKTKIAVNGVLPTDKSKLNIKAMFGFWTEKYISALGKNDSGGSSGGVDMATVWSALAGNTTEQINKSHLTTALAGYALKSDIPNLATLSWSGYSSGSYNGSSAASISIPNNTNQLTNGAGFITSSALASYIQHIEVGTDDLTERSGSFFFGGYETLTSGYDYVGIQVGNNLDKWQISALDTGLKWRQNDNGGTNTSWTGWRTILDSTNWNSYITLSSIGADAKYLPLSGGTMSNTNLVTNLNADMIDGYHASDFEGYYKTIIDTRNLDPDTWYPVLMGIGTALQTRIKIEGKTSATGYWNTRSDKTMAVMLDYMVQGSDWGWVEPRRYILHYTEGEGSGAAVTIGGLGQLTKSSGEFVFVRGGASYHFYISRNITPQLLTSTYTLRDQSISPTKTPPSLVVRNIALITDNVASATKLQTPRTIWGQSFDGSANISGDMLLDNAQYVGWKNKAGTAQRICIGLNSDNNFFVGYTTANSGYNTYLDGNSVNIRYGTSHTSGIYLNSRGNVGIGTTSPSYKLHVAGVIYSTTGIFSDGYVSALGQNTSSDIRKKDVKENFALSVDEIASAPSVKYLWKDAKDKGLQVGSIAQYWQNILPEAVHEDNDGYLTMQYGVIALLASISAARKVQDHERRIKELEKECERLRTEVEQLRA